MQIEKITNEKQKIIVIGLIVSDEFCKQITLILEFQNRQITHAIFTGFYKIIIDWCLDYYKLYNKSIKYHIQDRYQDEFEKANYSENELELISDFLKNLNDNYEREENYNEQYAIDQAKNYLRKSNLSILNKNISIALQDGKIEEGEQLVETFREIKKETDTIEIIDFFEKKNDIESIINQEGEFLFKFHGAFGNLVKDICRGDLISFTAPQKRGKSWILWETAIRACLCKLRVVFFSFEMTGNQVRRRGYQHILGEVRPKDIPENQDFIEINIPYFEENGEKFTINYKKIRKKGMNYKKITNKLDSLQTLIKNAKLKIICPPAYSMSNRQMEQILDDEFVNGFVPDIIIVDYADIMSPFQKKEYRHQLDDIWKGLRSLAQKKYCAVITATHSNNRTTGKKDISENDIVEDQRKLNHVACMIALNQKAFEKEKGYMRASVIASRHEDFNINSSVIILQNLKIGKPYIDSKWWNECILLEEK